LATKLVMPAAVAALLTMLRVKFDSPYSFSSNGPVSVVGDGDVRKDDGTRRHSLALASPTPHAVFWRTSNCTHWPFPSALPIWGRIGIRRSV
jgi:hypothetical protein